ncbi:chorismate mutase [Methanothermobacter tenebrarum]|jgi:chorismate mutase|uniref:Chorismate mutase n=1 Tax=Methanothermobacter tenebrarum TaxID=680118 RepID=A0ABN6PAF0_9EURY|nr:chorismate mutase [Methanothermobacter tenebrarum]MDD3454726.1 chorismate mutase [Methanobacteriales archaeon]MDI6881801.1 chorismate mutase [Methanothermobacter sp.]MDX9693647.1 chorismate mutase [Methanothermobacter sp.]BDH79200.1 chorismate mutase [Methanothermobacter tenebrarum]
MKKSEAMKLLKESREKIDLIDEKILNLISERTSLARKIIKAKIALNMDIWDPAREKQIEEKTRKIARENKIDEGKLIKIMRILTELNKMEQEQILRRK